MDYDRREQRSPCYAVIHQPSCFPVQGHFWPGTIPGSKGTGTKQIQGYSYQCQKAARIAGNLFILAVGGEYQEYIFVDNIDAMYPPPSPGTAEAAEPGRESDFDEFVRMLKGTVQCGRETITNSQQQINVIVKSCRLCEQKYLAPKEVSLSSKSLRLGENPPHDHLEGLVSCYRSHTRSEDGDPYQTKEC